VTADRSTRSQRSAGRSRLTQLKKRLQKLEKAQLKNDPLQIAKGMLSDTDLDLLEKLGYNKAALDPSQMAVWFRWESALEAAKAGLSYPLLVLSDVYARL
jgi:hypothetical protein